MIVSLRVKHGTDVFGNPIITLRNLPGENTEATPADLIELARVLLYVAEDSSNRVVGDRTYRLRDAHLKRPRPRAMEA